MTENTPDLEALAVEREELLASLEKSKQTYESRIRARAERLAEVEGLLTRHAPPGDSVQGSKQLRVTHKVSPAKDKLAEAYPFEDFPELWKSEIQATRVKAKIGEDAYSAYLVPTGKTQITITDTL